MILQRINYYWKTKSEELGYDVFLNVNTGELNTHADLQILEDAEIAHRREWKTPPSFSDLLRTYPTAKAVMKREVKRAIDEAKVQIECCEIDGTSPVPYQEELKKLSFQLAYLTEDGAITKAGLTREEIEFAKQTPVKTFVQVNAMSKTKCLFHADKTASMHVYNTNRFYCFGCHKSGSVVDVVMVLYSLTFFEACKKILGK